METSEFLKLKIKKNISRIPHDRLATINDFIVFLLSKSEAQELKPIKLQGVWKGSGFDRISDLEKELIELRREMSGQILKRKI